jgi:hypothetical protein
LHVSAKARIRSRTDLFRHEGGLAIRLHAPAETVLAPPGPPMRIQTKWFGPHGVREVRSGLSQFCKQSCTNGSCRTEKNEIVFLKDGVTQAKMFFGLFHICIAQAVRHLKLAASDGVRKRGTHVFANKYHLHRGDTKGESLSRSWHWLAATECNFDSSD